MRRRADLEYELDSEATAKSRAQQHRTTAIYKLVDIFSSITGKKIWIKDGKFAETDGTMIRVPFRDPNVYLYTEHEISHILFESDAQAAARFIDAYTAACAKVALQSGVRIRHEPLSDIIRMILNVLEDRRVDSLWGLLYPGSKAKLGIVSRQLLSSIAGAAHSNLIVYFLCVSEGVSVSSASKFHRYRSVLEQALRRVELKSFAVTLATTKWLIMKLVDLLIESIVGVDVPNASRDLRTRSQALDILSSMAKQTPDEVSRKVGDVKLGKFSSPAEGRAADDLVGEILSLGEDELPTYASDSAGEMREIIKAAREKLNRKLTKEQYLRRNAFAKVIFIDITQDDLDMDLIDADRAHRALRELETAIALTASAEKLDALEGRLATIESILRNRSADEATTKRLKALFYRVMGRKNLQLDDSGLEVDVGVLLERILNGTDSPVFKRSVIGRGFHAMLLLDRSLSMEGDKTTQAERACRILTRALDFPFVTMDIWGFQSTDNGQVDITRFSPELKTFSTNKLPVTGGTPLHIATRLAVQHLQTTSDSQHLFVVTDGVPSYADRTGATLRPSTMMKQTRDTIRDARSKGMSVTGILLGSNLGPSVHYSLSDREMSFMFGPKRNWKLLRSDTLGTDLVKLITTSFLGYLGR